MATDNVIPVDFDNHSVSAMGEGAASCLGCGHEWYAQAPTGTTRLECPSCHAMKGLFRFEFYPPEGTLVKVCDCGNELFYITPKGHMCVNCGVYQRYDP